LLAALLARSIPPSFYLLYGSFKLQKLSSTYPKEEVQTETQNRKPFNAKEQRSGSSHRLQNTHTHALSLSLSAKMAVMSLLKPQQRGQIFQSKILKKKIKII
jgi:hypothetical protein